MQMRGLISVGMLLFLALPCQAAKKKEAARPPEKNAADAIPRPAPVEPPAPAEIEQAIRRGVDFLVARQNKNGSWGSPTRTKGLNIFAPVPGAHHAFRAATTSLGVMALIESGDPRPEVAEAVDRAEAFLFEQLPHVRRATPTAIYNVWTHAYGMQALLRLQDRAADDKEKLKLIKKLVDQQIDLLNRYETVNGGWGYYDFDLGTQKPGGSPTSFTSATGLIALHEAKAKGYEIPAPLVPRTLASINRMRKPDFSYLYSYSHKWHPMYSINRPGGSLGRSQVCNLALRLWGQKEITNQVLIDWLDRLVARQLWLDIGRKRPVPHESHFAVAGYFYYYGHYYAAICSEQLPAASRAKYQAPLARILLNLQEKDGSWWDFPLYDYHQQYGTAFGVMSLVACRPTAESAPLPAGR